MRETDKRTALLAFEALRDDRVVLACPKCEEEVVSLVEWHLVDGICLDCWREKQRA